MLSSNGDGRLYAKGSGNEAGYEYAEEYWKWSAAARLSSQGQSITSGPIATVARSRRGPVESKHGPKAWLGWTDRLLQPRHLYVWGRRGEDWRIDDVVRWSPEVEGAVEVRVLHVEDARAGALHVIPDLGRVMLIELPMFLTWSIDEIDDNPDVGAWPLQRWFKDVMPERDTW
ncbi:hypothetical protein [Modestobacter sp. SSW1-42]|uniref:hypothetical protein n=1 Tax=Modestobacter sp. SSW1-42 TaxID=596372 RepID=UPI0039872D4E